MKCITVFGERISKQILSLYFHQKWALTRYDSSHYAIKKIFDKWNESEKWRKLFVKCWIMKHISFFTKFNYVYDLFICYINFGILFYYYERWFIANLFIMMKLVIISIRYSKYRNAPNLQLLYFMTIEFII